MIIFVTLNFKNMKRNLFLLIALSLVFTGFAQKRAIAPEHLRNYAAIKKGKQSVSEKLEKVTNPYVKSGENTLDEDPIGNTRYDNQSNASIPNRMYFYEDGTIGATWTRGMQDPMFSDRGTGYNYFDGTEWDTWPSARVEYTSCNRPTYTRWGANGEMIVTHTSGNGLIFSTREEKGTGTWDFSIFLGPPSEPYILWNRAITSGTNHDRVHLLALTLPTSHGGTPYQGLDGALLYSYSTDGGVNWYWENEILDGMASDEYTGFSADIYTFAEPKEDVVAFVVGDSWCDLFLMKSTDGGETFEKSIIWQHPYPMWEFGTPTDTFYCADGAHSLVIDNTGMVHVAFGITRALADSDNTYWYPFADGIGYWNENMPSFSDDVNALSPYGDPGSELTEDYNLIGWSQDVNQNGVLNFTGEIGSYFIGLSSMPQLVLDQSNQLFLIYSSVTETYSNGIQNYRHIWGRGSMNGGSSWYGFHDLTDEIVQYFNESVYPACAANSDGYIHLIYQYDLTPGTAVWGSQHPYQDNTIGYIKISKSTFLPIGIHDLPSLITEDDVRQNYPNPFNQSSEVKVILKESASLSLEVVTLTGQKVYETALINAKPGVNILTIQADNFAPGIYFYKVKAGESTVTKKMIVE
jgi:hypothetical protein